jgi:hypothetical protein
LTPITNSQSARGTSTDRVPCIGTPALLLERQACGLALDGLIVEERKLSHTFGSRSVFG